MSKVVLDQPALERHLVEQLSFLRASARAYDAGQVNEAKRLAVSVRILVHETRRSKALLGQLGLLHAIGFVDGGETPDSRNLAATMGLSGIQLGGGAPPRYVPKFGIPDYQDRTMRTFHSWWTRPVVVDLARNKFSRKDLVLVMADQDGGAHVDPSLEQSYARLSRQNSMGWYTTGLIADRPVEGIEFASVRQIAWELLETLEAREPLATPPSKDLPPGRNDPCACGSGLKYKRCHGIGL